MTEIKDCLPEVARKHFIDLRNIRLEAETAKYHQRLSQLRHEIAARSQGRSGWQEMEEWKYKEELSNNLAVGYVQDALETCRLYDIPISPTMCNCLLKAVDELLVVQHKNALRTNGQGPAGFRIPLSVLQEGDLRVKKILPQIRVVVEAARVEDTKKRFAMAQEKERYGHTYNQNITQHGGVINASQTGNVSAQQVVAGGLDDLRPALAEMRAFFKKQEGSLDADEYVGLLASAEKAAAEKDETKIIGYLKQIPSKAWDIGKAVIPEVLLHYLKLHGIS
jgi:hypothetical protein